MEQTRGKGAGGSNTNGNGLPYEIKTDLSTHFKNLENGKIKFNEFDKEFIRCSKGELFYKLKNDVDYNVKKGHGCKSPDECYIDEENKIVFDIEKKFQQVNGSVCEKIQTADFKRKNISKVLGNKYKIVYIYCLSDWFKDNCKAELEYLEEIGVPVFWGNDENYKSDIINFIVNYK